MALPIRIALAALVVAAALSLAACSRRPLLTMADLPVYPDAVAIAPEESLLRKPYADQILQNTARRAMMSVSAPSVEQFYVLPAGTTWEQAWGFYDERFTGDGWGPNALASGVMDRASAQNPQFKSANWRNGPQDVMVVMLTALGEPQASELIVYLYTREP